MKLTENVLRNLVLEVLLEEKRIKQIEEAKMEDLSDVCFVAGSTHSLATCKLGEDKYYLKFSDSWSFSKPSDKSMQIGVEYLAYKIYELYPSNTPEGIHVVSDSSKKRIGLATREVVGVQGRDLNFKDWVGSISGGAMVDIFLANWDVANTRNFVVDPNTMKASRVDPGGALTFRARGDRKRPFNPRAAADQGGELGTMLDPQGYGAGFLLSAVDAKKAASAFLSVEWPQIEQAIRSAHDEVSKELANAGLGDQLADWDSEVSEITNKLKTRHADVKEHCEYVMNQP